MSSRIRAPIALALSAVLGGCAGNPPPEVGPTLADLEPVTVSVEPQPLPRVSLSEVEARYRAALEVVQDPVIRRRIMLRLADIEMARSEGRQLSAAERARFYEQAIDLYRRLLSDSDRGLPLATEEAQFPRERLLYQLAKAYALDGQLEASLQVMDQLAAENPDSLYAPEANFRRADRAFSDANYAQAEQYYDRVVAAGQTPFLSNAIYMHGWSLFKQGDYEAALRSFTRVLDDLLVEGYPIEHLAESRQNLVADTLRTMAICFSYLGGPDAIAQHYEGNGQRHYQHLLYRHLGELYLKHKRYRDSAETFRRFAQLFPDTDEAPRLSVRAIEVYQQGDFPSLVRPAKEAFIRQYGPNSRWWEMRGLLAQEPLLPYLRQYLDDLATYFHAEAQDLKDAGEGPGSTQEQFLRAADYYRQFVYLFPMDEAISRMTFLMAEAYYESGALVEALEAYERVAYHYRDPEHGSEAGYAALLTLERLLDATPVDQQPEVHDVWRRHKIDNAVRFVDNYSGDARAPAVLATAAEDVYELGELKRALNLATRLTDWQPAPPTHLQKTAWLVRSHSLFDMSLFSAAEAGYRETLKHTEPGDEDRGTLAERIAISLYKQAEDQVASGDKAGAIERLLQTREVAPGSEVAMNSQYDAANYLIEMEQWERAAGVLEDFSRRYPNSELAETLPPKLALVYQKTQNWSAAARAVRAMMENEKEPEAKRQSLFLAAELFERAGDTAQAIVNYRQYAHSYPEPFNLATEARYKMVQLYEQTNQPLKRNYWLNKLVEAHEEAAGQGGSTERAHWLAAFSARELADAQYRKFRNIKLKLPLKQNMERKRAAMERALESYRRVLSYGLGEFTTEANNRIGMVYAELSQDLMESERPEGLTPLELEQYELLLEEQAFPFEEKAIEILEANAKRSWDGTYDKWVKRSFETLAQLLPARYGKQETRREVSDGIY